MRALPLVSIIMPVYNVERHIKKAIESVISQSYNNWELIIVNDGSTDSSKNIAEKYAFEDSRVKIINKKNGGLSDARNVGLLNAKGEYLCFIDSDDWIEREPLYNTIKLLLESNADIAILSFIVDTYNKKGELINSTSQQCDSYLLNFQQYNQIKEKDYILLDYAWNKIYKKEFLCRNNFMFQKGLSLIEDCEFNSRVLPKANSIIFISEIWNHYMIREEETLAKSFRLDSFNLIKDAAILRENMLKDFNLSKIDTTRLKNEKFLTGIKYCFISCLLYGKKYSFPIKIKFFKEILKDYTTISFANIYKPNNLKDKILKHIIKTKSPYFLYFLYYANSKIRRNG